MNPNKKFKPVVAQLRTGVTAQRIKYPVAPVVYHPQPTPKVLQCRRSTGLSSHAGQSSSQRVVSPVFPPSLTKSVQLKARSQTSVIQRSEKKGRFDLSDWKKPQPKPEKPAESWGEYNIYLHKHKGEIGYHIKIDNGKTKRVSIKVRDNGGWMYNNTFNNIMTELGESEANAEQLYEIVNGLRGSWDQVKDQVKILP